MQNGIRKYDNRQHLNSNLYKSLKVTNSDKSRENFYLPITMAPLKKYITFYRSDTGIMGTKPTVGVDIHTHRNVYTYISVSPTSNSYELLLTGAHQNRTPFFPTPQALQAFHLNIKTYSFRNGTVNPTRWNKSTTRVSLLQYTIFTVL